AQPLAPLGADSVHEAGKIEVVRLLLAAAAVRDEKRAPALRAHEVEEAKPRDPSEALVVEMASETVALDHGGRDRMVDEKQRSALRCFRESADRFGKQPLVVEQ